MNKRNRRALIRHYMDTAIVIIVFLAAGIFLGTMLGRTIAPEVVAEPVTVVEAAPVVMEVTEPVELPEPEPAPTYTEEDLEVLALLIYQEAGGDACSDLTRLMVGTVALNRVADPRFPDTLREVALQKSQYGRLHWTGLVWPERAANEGEAHAVARAYEMAERLLEGERALPEDVIFQAEFTQGTEVVAERDGFYFCK